MHKRHVSCITPEGQLRISSRGGAAQRLCMTIWSCTHSVVNKCTILSDVIAVGGSGGESGDMPILAI